MQQCSLSDEFITSCYQNVNVTYFISRILFTQVVFFSCFGESLSPNYSYTVKQNNVFFFLFSYMLYLYMQEVATSHLPVCNFPIICYDDLFVLSFSISSKVVEYCVNIHNMSLCCQGHW